MLGINHSVHVHHESHLLLFIFLKSLSHMENQHVCLKGWEENLIRNCLLCRTNLKSILFRRAHQQRTQAPGSYLFYISLLLSIHLTE
jgi:hypothetical protein